MNSCLNQSDDTRSLLFEDECIRQCSSQKYDWVSSVLHLHISPLHCLLQRTDQRSHTERWQRHCCIRRRNNRLSFPLVAMASAGRFILCSLLKTHTERWRPHSYTSLGFPASRYRILDSRRACASHSRVQIQHQQPQGVCNYRWIIRHHPLLFQGKK